MKNQTAMSKLLLVIFLFGICVVLTSSSVSAASTVYVNTTGGNDSNTGTIDHPYQTISKGISSVDENGTVTISDGVYTGTGNTNITLTKNMNITGQSQTGTIINGTGTNWIFNIISGVTVNISNLTFTNATTNNGGAIYNTGTLTVTNCTFTNNTAPFSDGGAIDNYYGGNIKSISGCTFTGNTAAYGGAIYNSGTINSVSGCTFTGNKASYGGAICNFFASLNLVSGCTFIGNTAVNAGGAIANSESGSTNASYNWWGSNNGPASGQIYGSVNYTPWLCMNVTAVPRTIPYNGSSTVTVSFNKDSNGNSTSGVCIPDGTIVTFNSTSGTFNHSTATTTNGTANVTFTGTSLGTCLINATTDSQTVSTNIMVDQIVVTGLTVNNATVTDGKSVNLTATLTDIDSNPLSGKTVTFTVNNKDYNAVTDSNGVATLDYTPSKAGTYTVTANFVDGTSYGNITGNAILTVESAAYLYLNTTTSNQNPGVGDTFILTYKLSNNGPDNATNVTISFQIPSGLEFVTASVDNGTWTYNATTRMLTWTLDSVPVGDPYLNITVTPLSTGSYTITPTIASLTANPNTNVLPSITINAQTSNNNNPTGNNGTGNNNTPSTVNAATQTIAMQHTGVPLAGLALAILAIFGGMLPRRKQ